MKRPKRNPVREDRIYNEAIVDARPEEQAMSWYYYLEGKISFPFQARCVAANAVSPLRKGETVEVLRMAVADACEHDMFVQTVGWSGKWQSLSLNCAPSIQTNQPKKHQRLPLLGRAGLLPVIYARPPKAHGAVDNYWVTWKLCSTGEAAA
jgi:hypothetical protein